MSKILATMKPYSERRNRTPLRDFVPLTQPLTLLIDPTGGCNFKCPFCPTGSKKTDASSRVIMKLDMFKSIIDGCAEFPQKIKSLSLVIHGEPTLNKNLPDMVKYAKRSGMFEHIETSTNGYLLTEETTRNLIDAGLDTLRFSIYGTDNSGYNMVTENSDAFDIVARNVADFFLMKQKMRPTLHVHCKIIDTNLTESQRKMFIETFSPIADSIYIDSIMGWSGSSDADFTLGLNPTTGMSGSRLVKDRVVCPQPFYQLAVSANGEVSPCCVDWNHDLTIGNASEQSMVAIWNSPRANEFRRAHLRGERGGIPTCRDCQFMQGLPTDADLDAERTRLLAYYL